MKRLWLSLLLCLCVPLTARAAINFPAGPYYSYSDPGNWTTGNYTLFIWVKWTSGTAANGSIFAPPYGSEYWMGNNGSGNLHLNIGGSAVIANAGALTQNVWFAVCLVHSGTDFTIYVGTEAWNGVDWNGDMTMPRAWVSALTQAECEAERTSATPVKSGVNRWYTWTTTTGATTDQSGNGNTLSVSGTPTTANEPVVVTGGLNMYRRRIPW